MAVSERPYASCTRPSMGLLGFRRRRQRIRVLMKPDGSLTNLAVCVRGHDGMGLFVVLCVKSFIDARRARDK
jgi:hypothetical protein